MMAEDPFAANTGIGRSLSACIFPTDSKPNISVMSRTAPLFYHRSSSAIPLPHELCSPWPKESCSEGSAGQRLANTEGFCENDITSLALIDIDDLETDTIYSNGSSDHDEETNPQETVVRPLTVISLLKKNYIKSPDYDSDGSSMSGDPLSELVSNGRRLSDMEPHVQANKKKRRSKRHSLTSTNIIEEFSSYFSMISESDAEYDEQGLSTFDSDSEANSGEPEDNSDPGANISTNRQPITQEATDSIETMGFLSEDKLSSDYEDITEDKPIKLSGSVSSNSSSRPLLMQDGPNNVEEALSATVEEGVVSEIHELYADTESLSDTSRQRYHRQIKTPYVPGSLIDSWFSDPIDERRMTPNRNWHGKGALGKMREKIRKVFSNFRQQPCAA